MNHCYKVIFELDGVEMFNALLDFNASIDFSFGRRVEGVESYLDAFVNSNIESLEASKNVGFSKIVVSVPKRLIEVSDVRPKKWRLPSSDEHVETKEGTEDDIILISGTRTPELKLTGKKVPLRTSANNRAMIDFERAICQMSGFDVVRKCKQYLEMYMSKSDLRDWCKEKLKELGS